MIFDEDGNLLDIGPRNGWGEPAFFLPERPAPNWYGWSIFAGMLIGALLIWLF